MKLIIAALLLVANIAYAQFEGDGYNLATPPLSAGDLPSGVTKTMLVDGYGDTPALARHDAFRTAIERAVGVVMTSETKVNNFHLIRDFSQTYSQARVSNFAVASVEQRGRQYYTQVWVTVQSTY